MSSPHKKLNTDFKTKATFKMSNIFHNFVRVFFFFFFEIIEKHTE